MLIQVLGAGCPKCQKLAEMVESVAKETKIPYSLEKITDLTKILEFNILTPPALLIDGKLKVVGRVPSIDEIRKILEN